MVFCDLPLILNLDALPQGLRELENALRCRRMFPNPVVLETLRQCTAIGLLMFGELDLRPWLRK